MPAALPEEDPQPLCGLELRCYVGCGGKLLGINVLCSMWARHGSRADGNLFLFLICTRILKVKLFQRMAAPFALAFSAPELQ